MGRDWVHVEDGSGTMLEKNNKIILRAGRLVMLQSVKRSLLKACYIPTRTLVVFLPCHVEDAVSIVR